MGKGYDKHELQPTTGSWTLPPTLVWCGIINFKVDSKIISHQETVKNISRSFCNDSKRYRRCQLKKLLGEWLTEVLWPSNWKRGEWTPAFEKEDPQDSRNYRPRTVLPVVSKAFEQLLSDQISKQFDSRLDPRIKVYRKHHSCKTKLISLKLLKYCLPTWVRLSIRSVLP